MENFTPISALIGGGLIGLAAALLLRFNGRIAGISGIIGGLVDADRDERVWRAAFLVGLVLGPLGYSFWAGKMPPIEISSDLLMLIVGGLLVGFGTRLGGGCTSGHGVCGISRLSVRSIVATCVFMAVAVVTLYVTRHILGWS